MVCAGTSDLIFTVAGTGTTTDSGTIINGGGFGFQKSGAGTLVLTGTESYAGNTTVAQGLVIVGPTGSLNSAGSLIVGLGTTTGTLQLGDADGPLNMSFTNLTGTDSRRIL